MAETPYEPRRFRSTVAWYERYRLDYPDRLIARVAALAGLEPGDPVLDLGTGTGMLAVPFARAGMAVTAMDPEPQMLAAAGEAAKAAGVPLDLVQGSSYDLTPAAGPFRLVVIGRAFHWMDRAATLQMLDRIVVPGGGVAFFHDAHPGVPENDWYKAVREVGDRYGRGDATHIRERRQGGHRRYEPFLFLSAFTMLDGLSVTVRRAISEDEIVGRAFSMSTCSPEKLGDRMEGFEADLRATLRGLSPDGDFVEVAELVALLARRPGSDGQEKCEATEGSEAVFRPAARPDKSDGQEKCEATGGSEAVFRPAARPNSCDGQEKCEATEGSEAVFRPAARPNSCDGQEKCEATGGNEAVFRPAARPDKSDGQEKCEATGGSEAVFRPAARPDKKP